MKKILMNSWGPGTGGASSVISATASELRQRGMEVDTLDHHYEPSFVLHSSKGEFIMKNEEELLKNIKWRDYSVLHTHACTFSEKEIYSARNENPSMPIIYTAHSYYVHEMLSDPSPKNNEYREWLESLDPEAKRKAIQELKNEGYTLTQTRSIGAADSTINMTPHGNFLLNTYYPEFSEKGVILPHGTDIGKYDTWSTNKTAAEIRHREGEGKILLYTGRLIPEKGCFSLMHAFGHLRDIHPDARLVLLGSTNDEMRRTLLETLPHGKRSGVHIYDWVNDPSEKASYYKAADLVVVPSFHESFCMTALEAMTLGTPVAISNVDGPREIWVKPMLAYGFDPHNVGDIVFTLDRILSSSETRRNAKAVKSVVESKYSLDNVTDALLGLYDSRHFKRSGKHIANSHEIERYYSALKELNGNRKFFP